VTSYVYTSVAANYIPKARVLLQTLRRFDPHSQVVIVVVDRISAALKQSLDEEFDEVMMVEDLPIPDFDGWIFQHTLVEACTAVKGFALMELLRRPDTTDVIYLDPDIALFGTIAPLRAHVGDVLLTPHLLQPEDERIWIERNEISALAHGTFNLGFLLVKASLEGKRFAAWWRDRLHWYCRADLPRGLFTDQRWADLVPSLFPSAAIVRDPGCNVATWNIAHRALSGNLDQGFRVEGEHDLRFFHFSGLDSGAQKQMLDLSAPDMEAAYVIRDWYLTECQRKDRGEAATEWAFNTFANGEQITLPLRQAYRASEELQLTLSNPFSVRGHYAFMKELAHVQ